MVQIIKIRPSKRKGKKLEATLDNGRVFHFGSKTSKTFSEGASLEKKKNYIARHKVNEDWTKPNAGSLSRFVLWSKPTIEQGMQEFNKKFKAIS